MEGDLKLVEFDKYCPTCVHNKPDPVRDDNSDGTLYVETREECQLCLSEPARPDSHKPLNYKKG